MRFQAALVVPTKDELEERTLRDWIKKGDVDLLVFPENYIEIHANEAKLASIREQVVEEARALAEEYGAPTLVGVWLYEVFARRGMQCAGYWNPKPGKGETREHFYAKHSTSEVLPYELPDYDGERDAMFRPIRLRDRNVGVELCHDQFFGLVSSRWVKEGADVIFDLTGNNVVPAKWLNVAVGRSLELGIPFLFTMADDPRNEATSNRAFSHGFVRGRSMTPTRVKEGKGSVKLFDLEGELEPLKAAQDYSPKIYDVLTIALAPSQAKAVIHVDANVPQSASWKAIEVDGKRVGVLALPADALRDPLCIHNHEGGKADFDAHVVTFSSATDALTQDEAIILARLRAIEHRVAVVVCTPSLREVIKSNRYKNIQRMKERPEGVFGIDFEFTGGTYESMGRTAGQGIPEEHQARYRALLDLLPEKGRAPANEGVQSRRKAKSAKRRSLLGAAIHRLGKWWKAR